MRRLVLAAVLALAFHCLLFTLSFEGPKDRLTRPPRPLTLSLDQAPAPTMPALSVSRVLAPQEEPRSLRPQPREEPSQKENLRPVQKPAKKTAPLFPSRQEPQDSSPDQAMAAENEVPLTGSSEGPSHADRASLEPGPASTSVIERDATPLYRLNPSPEYPLIGRKRGYQGTVILEVLVTREGRVGDLRVVASSGYSVLDQAALASVKTWIFDPGMRAGKTVDMWVKVPVRFQLE